MIPLPRRLRDTTLPALLAACRDARVDGTLRLREGGADHAIHLRRGEVLAVECAAQGPRLGDVVVAVGVGSREAVERAWEADAARGWRIGQSLVGRRLLSPRDRDRLLQAQRAHRLAQLCALGDARVWLAPPSSLPPGAAEQPPMSARELAFSHVA